MGKDIVNKMDGRNDTMNLTENHSRPPIGTKVYCVREHYYYQDGRRSPDMEYIVEESVITKYCKGKGRREEVRHVGKDADGYCTPFYTRVSDIGNYLFTDPAEAAELARKKTEIYESIWLKYGDVPLRRPWEKLLKGGCYERSLRICQGEAG